MTKQNRHSTHLLQKTTKSPHPTSNPPHSYHPVFARHRTPKPNKNPITPKENSRKPKHPPQVTTNAKDRFLPQVIGPATALDFPALGNLSLKRAQNYPASRAPIFQIIFSRRASATILAANAHPRGIHVRSSLLLWLRQRVRHRSRP